MSVRRGEGGGVGGVVVAGGEGMRMSSIAGFLLTGASVCQAERGPKCTIVDGIEGNKNNGSMWHTLTSEFFI